MKMKKLLSLFLALALILTTFASCGEAETALTATELLDLGEKYLLDLDYEQAIVYFNQVIEVEPRNSRAYMGAAEAYVGLGDTESAINLLKTALGVFADDEEVTIELLEMLIEIDPSTAEWYITLAQIYIDNGDTAKAAEILQQGLSNASNTTEIEALLNQLSPDLSELKPTSYYYYDEDGNITNSQEFEYYSNGNMAKSTFVSEYGVTTINEFDSNGNNVKSTSYSADGDSGPIQEYEYDDNGNVVTQTYSHDGLVWAIYEYEYDTSGNLVRQINKNASYTYSGGIYSDAEWHTGYIYYEYEYDSDGNITKEVARYEYGDGAAHYVFHDDTGETHEYGTKTTEYEYDEDGNVTKTTTTNSSTDGTVVVSTYENNNSSSGTASTPTVEYDAYGKVISYSTTIDGTTYYTEYEYEFGDDGKVQKCVMTGYNADTGNISSVATLERIS